MRRSQQYTMDRAYEFRKTSTLISRKLNTSTQVLRAITTSVSFTWDNHTVHLTGPTIFDSNNFIDRKSTELFSHVELWRRWREVRFRDLRKREWGKYVAEIRSGKRSRISLGSYFTAEAAARAYDTALLCHRGAQASSFNFQDSKFNMEVENIERNPSAEAIRTAAIRVGSICDVIPARCFHNNNNNQIFEEAEKGLSHEIKEATYDKCNRTVEEKMVEQKEVMNESSDV